MATADYGEAGVFESDSDPIEFSRAALEIADRLIPDACATIRTLCGSH